MSLSEEIRKGIKRLIESKYGTQEVAAEKTGIAQATISRIVGKKDVGVDYRKVADLMDKLGVEIRWPDQISQTERPLTFSSPVISPNAEMAPPPESDDYRAIPLTTAEVAAGPGLVPQEGIEGWCILWRNIPSLLRRSNLICSRIARTMTSMEPTLHPGDYIVVDRDDVIVPDSATGNIFLVRDPHDGLSVKRVSIRQQGSESIMILHSDNKSFPPNVINLTQEFDNDLSRALIGRVVYSWTDMSKQ